MRVPEARDHVRRGRLLDEIEQNVRRAAVTWVTGLPGSGKTSAVARWVADQRRRVIWYRLDENDGDAARLFDALNPDKRLAVWSPMNRMDPSEFSPAFFADLATEPVIIVLDDCHRVPDDAPILAMLRALHDLGAELRFVAISRRRPPPELARGLVAGWLGLVDDLRLDADEAEAIAERIGGRKVLRAELAVADGWLAHVLLLAHGREKQVDGAALGDFLAAELLASLPAHRRAALRHLAELPEIPDDGGSPLLPAEIARLLASLASQRYFVDHAATYRLHDLLREALLRMNEKEESVESLRTVRSELATWIERSMPEAALQLRVAARDTTGALVVLEAHGAAWLARGLHRSVLDWTSDLPEPSDPQQRAELALWRAQALVPIEPEAARPLFAAARRSSVEARDVRRAYLAWCGEVSSYVIQWGAVEGLADLVDELERLNVDLGPEPEDLHLRTHSDALTALMYGRAEDPRLERFADATARAVTHSSDANARIGAAAQLLMYRLWGAGDLSGGRALCETFDREVSERDDLAALPRLLWWSVAAIVDWQCGAPEACYAKVERGLALAASSGVHVRDFVLLTQGIFCSLGEEDWPRTEHYLGLLARTERKHKRLDVMIHYFFRSWYGLARGAARTALAHAKAAWAIADEFGSAFHKMIALSVLAPAHVRVGDFEGAERVHRSQVAIAEKANNPAFQFIALCGAAELALAKGDHQRARTSIERMLILKEQGGFPAGCGWRSDLLRDVLVFALRHDVHPEIAKAWIREKNLSPPPTPPPAWPTTIRIETEDGLRVLGREAAAGTKPAKKLRELLAVLCVRREGATQLELADWLWPDADGDRAAASLKAAVHRLRQWIGAESVLVVEGRTKLNAAQVTCDLWERRVDPERLLRGFELVPVNTLRQSLRKSGDRSDVA